MGPGDPYEVFLDPTSVNRHTQATDSHSGSEVSSDAQLSNRIRSRKKRDFDAVVENEVCTKSSK